MRPLAPVGRATRVADVDGELWRLPAGDALLARRLVELGGVGVGGFFAWGEDVDGAWMRRAVIARSADEARAVPWREALEIVRGVAAALAACERASLSPGRLHPAAIAVAPSVWVEAQPLVSALVAGEIVREGEAVGRWVPPEQAAGAPWDAAANRYVLGLVAYRLVAGEHPFAGAGLRGAIAGQAIGAPPFEAGVAARTRPGVQALVLAMLDPDARARPRDAAAIALRCEELLGTVTPVVVDPPSRRAAAVAAPRPRLGAGLPRADALKGLGLLAGFAIVAGLVSGALGAVEPPRREAPVIAPQRSLTEASASACAPCHAREVAEWSRSVMAHASRSPLFGALESVVEEQVGRDLVCPSGAGVLRRAGGDVCRSDESGRAITGAGGEGWCIHCHAPAETLRETVPAWQAHGSTDTRAPLRDLLSEEGREGVTCLTCHQAVGPVAGHARATRSNDYEGNATWRSFLTGEAFAFRPEDARGRTGIGNSGYHLDPAAFFASDGSAHETPGAAARAYARSSEACGACHDVRLFGSDVLGVAGRGEHFKRLRNAYSEWRAWADSLERRGRVAPTCQACHMSLYPGVCAGGGDGGDGCPKGTHFEPRVPGDTPVAFVASASARPRHVAVHGFASVDVPMARDLPDAFADDVARDAFDLPLGIRARRDLLLAHALRFSLETPRRGGGRVEIPVVLENTGAGHRVPAGFSQEREIWVELTVSDDEGRLVYRVGHLDAPDEDLRDKTFLRVNVDGDGTDARGRPLGMFGADVADGPDVPRWSPAPGSGATTFRGRGLANLQNGFFRCVRCVGVIDARGVCTPGPGQGSTRGDRFADGDYDADTGECRSNLEGSRALFETYFPVGALDASRGVAKAPDAILDTRSAAPEVPLTYVYVLDASGARGPLHVQARLLFRAFPPYLVRAFAAYEARMDARGLRPSGPQVDLGMLRRLDVVELARAEARVE